MAKNKPEIEKYCIYCEHSVILHDEDFVLCRKHGVVSSLHKCRKFAYDPLKRKPAAVKLPPLEFVKIDR